MNTWVKKALSPTRDNLGVHIHQNWCSHKSEYAVGFADANKDNRHNKTKQI